MACYCGFLWQIIIGYWNFIEGYIGMLLCCFVACVRVVLRYVFGQIIMLSRGMYLGRLAICVLGKLSCCFMTCIWVVLRCVFGQMIVLFRDMYLGCLAMCIWAYDCVVSWDLFGLSCDVYLGI